MEPEKDQYHISFFKPTTDSARRNRNIVVQLVLIWAVAIFGFQILLKLLEKPTPEPALLSFQESWAKMEAGEASLADKQEVAKSALSILGKVAINPADRELLDGVVSYLAFEIADNVQKTGLESALLAFEKVKNDTLVDMTDPEYLYAKSELMPRLYDIFNLEAADVRGKIAPLEISMSKVSSFDSENREQLAGIMGFYLTHNQSILTDSRFLGFPFHYFYTAVFLLVLFVGLCWLYCFRIDLFNKKYGIDE